MNTSRPCKLPHAHTPSPPLHHSTTRWFSEAEVPIHGVEETKILIQERVRKTSERLEADFSKIETKIHRFPQGLREIGDRYIVPRFVSLGPYHHGLPHLQEVEEVKDVAAYYFCTKSGHSVEEVYGKILSVAGEARRCYADEAVAHFSDIEFAEMMFLDGCFLLRYIGGTRDILPLLRNRMSTGPRIRRDIFLLENQLPWLVLDALMTFTTVDVYRFVVKRASDIDASSISATRISQDKFKRYKPPHLLGLLRYYLIDSMPPEDLSVNFKFSALASSAIELAEIGIKLTASNKEWFADMSIEKELCTGELSLTPLFLNDYTACWLINMAAFEACTSTNWPSDGYTISSYLSLLAMLMDKEEDVHELRAKHLVHSAFSNREMLDFFKGLDRHLKLGYRFRVTMERIYEYKHERPVLIAVHKFLYNYYKTIAALLSITGVLVGIFKALLSIKQH